MTEFVEDPEERERRADQYRSGVPGLASGSRYAFASDPNVSYAQRINLLTQQVSEDAKRRSERAAMAYDIPAIERDVLATEARAQERSAAIDAISARLKALQPPDPETPGLMDTGESMAALVGAFLGDRGAMTGVQGQTARRQQSELEHSLRSFATDRAGLEFDLDRAVRDADTWLNQAERRRGDLQRAKTALAGDQNRIESDAEQRRFGLELSVIEQEQAERVTAAKEAAQARLQQAQQEWDKELLKLRQEGDDRSALVRAALDGLSRMESDDPEEIRGAVAKIEQEYGIELAGAADVFVNLAVANKAERTWKESVQETELGFRRRQLDYQGQGLAIDLRGQNLAAAREGLAPTAGGGFVPLDLPVAGALGAEGARPPGGQAEQDWQQLFNDMDALDAETEKAKAGGPLKVGGMTLPGLAGASSGDKQAELRAKVKRHREAVWARLDDRAKGWVGAMAQTTLREINAAKDEEPTVSVGPLGLPNVKTSTRKEKQDGARARFRKATGFDLDFGPLKAYVAELRKRTPDAGGRR